MSVVGFTLLNRIFFFCLFFYVVMAATGIQLTLLSWGLFFTKRGRFEPGLNATSDSGALGRWTARGSQENFQTISTRGVGGWKTEQRKGEVGAVASLAAPPLAGALGQPRRSPRKGDSNPEFTLPSWLGHCVFCGVGLSSSVQLFMFKKEKEKKNRPQVQQVLN